MAQSIRVNIDPSIRGMARHLVADVIQDVERDLLARRNFYVARAKAIEARADEWVSRYGKETADLAVRALHVLREEEFLSDRSKRSLKRAWKEDHRSLCRAYGRDSWINRVCIAVFGVPFN